MRVEQPVAWRPQRGPQSDAISSAAFCRELFYGGAVFGGKSDFLLGDFLQDIDQGSDWVGVLFRRSAPELDDIIERSQEIYPYTGGEYLVGHRTWRWRNGALLRLRHMETEADFEKYMGWSVSWLAWDELPNWPSLHAYRRMLSRLRGPARDKRVRATGNPGGRCHAEIKEYFHIDTKPLGYDLFTDPVSHSTKMYIPSRVSDNKIGLASDPEYVDRLKGVGDPELVAAWLDGDWDAVVGAYFSMFRRSACEVEPFEIPDGWQLFTCLDYGEANATWCGILAVDYDDDVWVVDEYYRVDAGGAEHARGVRDMLANCPYIRGRSPLRNLAPHDMWTKRRPGEASEARAPEDAFREEGVFLTRANMDRVNGWRNLKDLLYADRLHFFKGRTEHVCSSLASVQRDPTNAEDVLKGGDDHACLAGETVVLTAAGPAQIKDLVGTEGLVYSSDGKLHPYSSCRETRRGAATVRLVFDDGRTVTCTPDHRFLSDDGEWIEARALKDVRLWTIQSESQKQRRTMRTRDTICAASTSRRAGMGSVCIGASGRIATAPSQTASMYTTGMATEATTRLTTSNSSVRQTTQGYTLRLGISIRPPRPLCASPTQPRGTGAKRGVAGMQSTPMMGGSQRAAGGWPRSVSFAGDRSRRTRHLPADRCTAGGDARTRQCKDVNPGPTATVYCLSVPGPKSFAIEGGTIVHNCDGLRLGVNHVYKPRRIEHVDVPLTAGSNILDLLQAMGNRKTRYG